MIKSFRKQIKLIKYGSNIKSSIAAAALFFILGLLFLVMDSEGLVLGSLYIFAGLLMLLQVYNTLLSIGMVTASPKRRMLETWLIDILGLLTGICYYIFLLIIAVIKMNLEDEAVKQQYGTAFLFAGMIGGWVLVYCGMAWKSFLISVIVFSGGFFVIFSEFSNAIEEGMSINPGIGAMLGILAVVLGAVIAGIIRRVLYKIPVSKYAMGANLRKQM